MVVIDFDQNIRRAGDAEASHVRYSRRVSDGSSQTLKPSQFGRLGPLEWRVLDALWLRAAPASVRDLAPGFPESAYTTVMTTADRLYQKGLLAREKRGRQFVYWPVRSRGEWTSALCLENIQWALGQSRSWDDAVAIASCLADALARHDPALLDTLEALVRERRANSSS